MPPPEPEPSARLDLHALQRFGSFLTPLSANNICSPAVKTNSALHSEHFRTRSLYSMSGSKASRPLRGWQLAVSGETGLGQSHAEASAWRFFACSLVPCSPKTQGDSSIRARRINPFLDAASSGAVCARAH